MPRDPKTGTLTISTLGDLVDDGSEIRVYCRNDDCLHAADIDVAALAERLGRDHSCLAKNLTPRLICSKCGGRTFQFTISPRVHGQMGY